MNSNRDKIINLSLIPVQSSSKARLERQGKVDIYNEKLFKI